MGEQRNHGVWAVAALVAAVSLAAAPIPAPKPAKNDLESMQGRWKLVAEVLGGVAQPAENFEVEISGNKLVYYRDGNKLATWRIRLNTDAGAGTIDLSDWFAPDPVEMIARRTQGPGSAAGYWLGGLGSLHPIRGCYRVEGDRLMICTAPWWGNRPCDFTGGGDNEHLRVYSRKLPQPRAGDCPHR